MKQMTTTQLANEVLQFCIDHPQSRNDIFDRVGNGAGVLQLVALWLAVQEHRGKPMATLALDALLRM